MTETGWLIGLSVAFLCGWILGYAWKSRAHEKELSAVMRIMRRAIDGRPVQKEAPQGPKPPGRPADPPRFIRVMK